MNAAVKKKSRQVGYVIAIIVNAILMFVFNNLSEWNIPFITTSFSEVLWAFNLSIGATIITNALYLVYDAGWFHHLTQMILTVLGFNSVYWLYIIFPLDLRYAIWAQAMRIALIMAMIGTAIAFIVELGKLIGRKD